MEEQTLRLPDILFRAKQEQQKKLTGVQEGGGNNYRVVDCLLQLFLTINQRVGNVPNEPLDLGEQLGEYNISSLLGELLVGT